MPTHLFFLKSIILYIGKFIVIKYILNGYIFTRRESVTLINKIKIYLFIFNKTINFIIKSLRVSYYD